jgi:hypothetical protein
MHLQHLTTTLGKDLLLPSGGNVGDPSELAQWGQQGPFHGDGSYDWGPRLSWLLASPQAWGVCVLPLFSIVYCHASFISVECIVVLVSLKFEKNTKNISTFCFYMLFPFKKHQKNQKYFSFSKTMKIEQQNLHDATHRFIFNS